MGCSRFLVWAILTGRKGPCNHAQHSIHSFVQSYGRGLRPEAFLWPDERCACRHKFWITQKRATSSRVNHPARKWFVLNQHVHFAQYDRRAGRWRHESRRRPCHWRMCGSRGCGTGTGHKISHHSGGHVFDDHSGDATNGGIADHPAWHEHIMRDGIGQSGGWKHLGLICNAWAAWCRNRVTGPDPRLARSCASSKQDLIQTLLRH